MEYIAEDRKGAHHRLHLVLCSSPELTLQRAGEHSPFLFAPNISGYRALLLKVPCSLVEVFPTSPYPPVVSLHVGHVGFPIGDPL